MQIVCNNVNQTSASSDVICLSLSATVKPEARQDLYLEDSWDMLQQESSKCRMASSK